MLVSDCKLSPISNSLTFLLIVASVTCSAYVYMLYLLKDKWIALLGAIIVGMSPYVVGYQEHTELRFIATMPLSMYFFHRGIAERRYKLVLIAAILVGITAYVSMYTLICLSITLGLYALYFAASRWKEAAFWIALGLFVVIAGTVSSLRVFPMLKSSHALDEVVALRRGKEVGSDLLEYFINGRHPITKSLYRRPLVWEANPKEARYSSYLGYTVLVLIGIGFLQKPYRHKMIPWMVLALPFLVLRLGSVLTIEGITYPNIVLPKHFLDELIPGVFEAFGMTANFYMGVLLPLAVLSCHGAISDCYMRCRKDIAPQLYCFWLDVVSFEYYQPVRQGIIAEQDQLAFLGLAGRRIH